MAFCPKRSGDRLLHAAIAGLASVAQRQGQHGHGRIGAGADHAVWRAGPRAAIVPVALGQRPGVHRFESQQHATRVVGDWIQFYNHRRPHQALGMKTPAEAYALIDGQPWTAPAYDALEIPRNSPPRVFCMASGHDGYAGCSCLTEQGTRYVIEQNRRRLIATDGQYEPFIDTNRGNHAAHGRSQSACPPGHVESGCRGRAPYG